MENEMTHRRREIIMQAFEESKGWRDCGVQLGIQKTPTKKKLTDHQWGQHPPRVPRKPTGSILRKTPQYDRMNPVGLAAVKRSLNLENYVDTTMVVGDSTMNVDKTDLGDLTITKRRVVVDGGKSRALTGHQIVVVRTNHNVDLQCLEKMYGDNPLVREPNEPLEKMV